MSEKPIQNNRLSSVFQRMFSNEKSGGILLIICTVLSLTIANLSFGEQYIDVWNTKLGGMSIAHWINDGLMVIFFLMVGLELKREIYIGELSNIGQSLLPIVGALGGLVIPASIYLAFNYGTLYESGAGIPMATDIAFAIGVLSLLGDKVPLSLKVFLTALAVIDDMGAIIVIALFYSSDLSVLHLAGAAGVFLLLFAFNRFGLRPMWPFLVGGLFMWYFMLHSGVHATITGVLLAFVIPFGGGERSAASYRLQHALHRPVTFGILPLFALANTCIYLGSDWAAGLMTTLSLGVIAGLVIGKPLGIFSFVFLTVKMKWCVLPGDLSFKHILGAGMLGGIGFTMSIFISLLAFSDPAMADQSKMAILIASVMASWLGYTYLNRLLSGVKVGVG